MTSPSPRKIFVNLPVADLKRSMAFFSTLGFGFNPQFTNEQAACMVVGQDAFVMLLVPDFFKNFTQKGICDTSTQTETINGFSVGSRAEVDEVFEKVVAAGGRAALEAQDHGFMYSRSFYDLDGHHWEVLWMDPAAIQ